MKSFVLIFVVAAVSSQCAFAQQCDMQMLVSALTPYDNCLNNIMDQLFNQRGMQDLNLQAYLQRLCDTVATTTLESCHRGLEQQLSRCVNVTQRRLLDILKSASWSGLRYICRDRAQLLTEFRETGRGFECLRSSDSLQSNCMSRTPILSMYIEQYDGQFCQVIQPRGLECLRQSFQEARCTVIAAQFLNGYYDSLTQATPCVVFRNGQIRNNEGFIGLISVLLITSFYII